MKTLYLAHNFELRKTIRKWELRLEGKYDLNLDNPFYDNINRYKDMKVLDNYKDGGYEQKMYLKTRDFNSIVEDDLEKIRKSDGIVALANQTRIGTPMEIFFAARVLHIPVYVITKRYAFHPWIKKFATRVFSNRAEFERFVATEYGMRR